MEHKAKLARVVIGMRALGLLRRWPLGDDAEAEQELRTIAEMLASRDDVPLGEILHFEALDIADGYAAWSETYDVVPNPLIDVEERILRSLLDDMPPGDALDVACGTGRVTDILSALGHRVVGIDPSEEMLDRAKAKGIHAPFRLGSVDALPVEDTSIDLVTCTLALTHVTDLGPPIREFARVLRPGGVAITTDVDPSRPLLAGRRCSGERTDRARSRGTTRTGSATTSRRSRKQDSRSSDVSSRSSTRGTRSGSGRPSSRRQPTSV